MEDEKTVKLTRRRVAIKPVEKASPIAIPDGNGRFTNDQLNRDMADFRFKMLGYLNRLAEIFTDELNNLGKIKLTISDEKKEIERLHEIKVNASSLEDLLKKQAKEKEEFDENISQAKKDWQRQLEERQYKFELESKHNKDLLEEEKNLLRKKFQEQLGKEQKEMEERKRLLMEQEKELGQLRIKTASFPAELEQAIKQTREDLQKELQKEFAVETRIKTQEYTSQKQILELKISELEKQNTRQTGEIELLRKQFESASGQLKDIAVKVIESKNDSLRTGEAERKEK